MLIRRNCIYHNKQLEQQTFNNHLDLQSGKQIGKNFNWGLI